MFDFFKILFSQPIIRNSSNDEELPEEPIVVEQTVIKKEVIRDKIEEPIVVKKQPIPKKNKEINMSEIFLVVIDTTGRPEAKGMTKGIQNFYFVYAADESAAKNLVFYTFRNNRAFMAQIETSVRATKLSAIVGGMNQQFNFWSFVPFSGQRRPGQQAFPPSQNSLEGVVTGKDGEQKVSARGFDPYTKVDVGNEEYAAKHTLSELRGVRTDFPQQKAAPAAPAIPTMPANMTPEQMQMMMSMMAQMFAGFMDAPSSKKTFSFKKKARDSGPPLLSADIESETDDDEDEIVLTIHSNINEYQ
jgi:hypothetical protein